MGYAASWLRRPGFLIALLAFLGLFGLFLWFVNPCGKHDYPVGGICASGGQLHSPLDSFLVGVLVALLFVPFIIFNDPNDSHINMIDIIKSIRNTANKRPKWRKRWYPVTFVVCYTPLAAATYVLNIGSGLPWYNLAGQYLFVVPFFTAMIASPLLTWVRKFLRDRKRRTRLED